MSRKKARQNQMFCSVKVRTLFLQYGPLQSIYFSLMTVGDKRNGLVGGDIGMPLAVGDHANEGDYGFNGRDQ
jgi:hypothetical protein